MILNGIGNSSECDSMTGGRARALRAELRRCNTDF